MRIEDLDLGRGEAVLWKAKGDRPAVVVLGREIREHLGWFIGNRVRGPVFEITPRHARRQIRHWCKRAGIRTAASPHTLRHSFATSLYRETGDVLLVRKALHHRSLESTLRYAHASNDDLRRVLG